MAIDTPRKRALVVRGYAGIIPGAGGGPVTENAAVTFAAQVAANVLGQANAEAAHISAITADYTLLAQAIHEANLTFGAQAGDTAAGQADTASSTTDGLNAGDIVTGDASTEAVVAEISSMGDTQGGQADTAGQRAFAVIAGDTLANTAQAEGLVGIGPDLVTNGTFDTDASGWTLQAGWQWNAGGYIEQTGDANWRSAYQNIGSVVGRVYKVTLDVNAISGLLYVRVGSNGPNYVSTTGTHTLYIEADPSNPQNLYLLCQANQTVEVDNVSAQEITSDLGVVVSDTQSATVSAQGVILSLAQLTDVTGGQADTAGERAFAVNAGSQVESTATAEGASTIGAIVDVANTGEANAAADTSDQAILDHTNTGTVDSGGSINVSSLHAVELGKTAVASAQTEANLVALVNMAAQAAGLATANAAIDAGANLGDQTDGQVDAQASNAFGVILDHTNTGTVTGGGVIDASLTVGVSTGSQASAMAIAYAIINAGATLDKSVIREVEFNSDMTMSAELGAQVLAEATAAASVVMTQELATQIVAQAAIDAGITTGQIVGVTFEGAFISADLITPEGRLFTVAADARVFVVTGQDGFIVSDKERLFTVDENGNIFIVPSDNRTFTVH